VKSEVRIQNPEARRKEKGERLYRGDGVSGYRRESNIEVRGDTEIYLKPGTWNLEPETWNLRRLKGERLKL
jgi:hypothetical protein